MKMVMIILVRLIDDYTQFDDDDDSHFTDDESEHSDDD